MAYLSYKVLDSIGISEKIQRSRSIVPSILDNFEGVPFNFLVEEGDYIDIPTVDGEMKLYGFSCKRLLNTCSKGLLLKVWRIQDGEFSRDDVPLFKGLNGGD